MRHFESRVLTARKLLSAGLVPNVFIPINPNLDPCADLNSITIYLVFRCDPEGIDDVGRGYLYVGETSKPIEERFEQHRTGARNTAGTVKLASAVVYKRGLYLRHDLIPGGVYFSRKASKEAEARLAERLRERGYRVEGGH
jgi:hypothetical protein